MKGRSIAEVAAGAVVLLVAAGFLAYAVLHSGRGGGGAEGMRLTARFDRIDGLANGADVRIAGVKVGSVTDSRIDPATFGAEVTLRVDRTLRLPSDTSAEITSEGLLGGKYVSLVPGGAERPLADGGRITTQMNAQQAGGGGDGGGAAAPGAGGGAAAAAPGR